MGKEMPTRVACKKEKGGWWVGEKNSRSVCSSETNSQKPEKWEFLSIYWYPIFKSQNSQTSGEKIDWALYCARMEIMENAGSHRVCSSKWPLSYAAELRKSYGPPCPLLRQSHFACAILSVAIPSLVSHLSSKVGIHYHPWLIEIYVSKSHVWRVNGFPYNNRDVSTSFSTPVYAKYRSYKTMVWNVRLGHWYED